jgi:hypothetical protein
MLLERLGGADVLVALAGLALRARDAGEAGTRRVPAST